MTLLRTRLKPSRTKPKNARATALLTLLDVDQGRFPEESLDKYNAGLNQRDRALAAALVYGVLRHRLRLEWILKQFLTHPGKPLDPVVRGSLLIGLFQITYLDRVPNSAAVNESVNLTRTYGPPDSSKLVNGVLRAITRAGKMPDPGETDLSPHEKLSVVFSHPDWMVKQWVDRLGMDEASKVLEANNQFPPLTLRVNTARIPRNDLAARLKERLDLVEPTPFSPYGLRVHGSTGIVSKLPGFSEGFFTVQDEASQIAALLAGPGKGERALDACAGRGGKSMSMASKAAKNSSIWALDPDRKQLGMIQPEAIRLGLKPLRIIHGSLLENPFKAESFEVVLVDAPCSNLGAIRRRPDVKWLKFEPDIKHLSELQLKLLRAAARLVTPRGRLIYSVCTSTLEETIDVVDRFTAGTPGFKVVPIRDFLPRSAHPLAGDGDTLQTWPHLHQMDGFFMAILSRN
ncbi:MAG: 16S rRNA (cytosine(967)-C(5))-methyltransferase RsmB [Deltaproteobacteria bacterium]|nr:16S rRNA (cytosine(967)-C(5))-methyltransferase RsmB [Deltaproteobacteria bacterium]